VNLTAYFENRGSVDVSVELLWDIANGAHISRHIFTDEPITARRATHELTVLVEQATGYSVDLRLSRER
jgi:hypothetical protein